MMTSMMTSLMASMRIGSTIGRRLALAAVPLAFAAALPLVQWCPLGAEMTLRDCLPDDRSAAAAPAMPACPAEHAMPTCAGEHAGCSAREADGGGCPFQHTAPTRCIGAPLGGRGLRPLSPRLHPPALQSALDAAAPPVVEAPRDPAPTLAQADARPPTRSWARRPPVRGPPLG